MSFFSGNKDDLIAPIVVDALSHDNVGYTNVAKLVNCTIYEYGTWNLECFNVAGVVCEGICDNGTKA